MKGDERAPGAPPAPAVDRSNRTRVCSIVFIDIVKYSTQHVEQQVVVKEHFNNVLRDAIENVAPNERIILDTGDGAAVCFLGDPEEAFFAAWFVRNAVLENAKGGDVPYQVRIGVNLGPVRVVKDINGNLNVLGDGINDAQRVMNIAQNDQVLVSRSFYEVVSKLSSEYSGMLQYLGIHKDKHVREHTVFQVVPPGTPITPAPPATDADVASATTPADAAPLPAPAPAAPALVLAPETQQELERALARELGPIAKALVKKYLTKSATLHELKDRLAAEIPSDKSKKAFLEAVKNLQ